MRVFIAIEITKEIQETLSKLQAELKTAPAGVKWINPKNIHLTLKFLGEVEEHKIPKIMQSLKKVSSNFKPFAIELSAIGGFPTLQSPRIIWVGIEKGKEELKVLAGAIEDALIRLEFPKEARSLSAHLTIGRVKYIKDKKAFSQKICLTRFSPLPQEVKSIILFKSTLTPKGPIYEKLSEESFQKN